MNIVLANLRTKNPKVHRSHGDGPICGARHQPLTVRGRSTKDGHDHRDEDQYEIELNDPRREAKPPQKPETIQPLEEYIEDIGDITCRRCQAIIDGACERNS